MKNKSWTNNINHTQLNSWYMSCTNIINSLNKVFRLIDTEYMNTSVN